MPQADIPVRLTGAVQGRARATARCLAPLRTLVLASMLVAAVAACGGGGGGVVNAPPPAASTPPLATPGTWVVLGSSTAAGTGATAGQGWVALMAGEQTARGVSVVNLAVGGALSWQALPNGSTAPPGRPAPDTARNVDAALARGARLLLVSYPSNDTAAGYSADETVANLQAVDRAARAGGAAVLVLSSQPRDTLGAAQRATLEDIDRRASTAFGPCFVSLRTALSDPAGGIAPAYTAGDGIHVNAAGHALIAQRVGEVLRAGQCVRL